MAARGDVLTMSDGTKRDGKVLGVQGTGVLLQTPAGTAGWPISNIKDVQMAAPPEFALAQKAFAAKDVPKALQLVKGIADKFKGLPVDWARQATGMVGDAYIATNDLVRAEAAYKEFQRLYPSGGSTQAEVGMARIAISKKDFAGAKAKLAPIAEAALKEKNVSSANAFAYSNAFLALGEIEEHDGNLPAALEDYLRTVTLFYHDPTAVAAAQEKAEALRGQKITVP